ncbi:MAG: adenylyltransferase/cytidyltransferase family protein [Clostridia bacterium]|nr:adenylyltransferase/cytidyltransferase family protein [Clostridia bacterium]
MVFENVNQLSEAVEKIRNGKKVILATGTFDLFHYEHLKYLEGAKQHGDILVVAVKSDKCASLKNPDRPYIKQMERTAIVDAIKYVDYSIIVDYDSDVELEVEPENEKQREWLIIFQELFKTLRPDYLYYEYNPVLQSARDKVFEKYDICGISKERGKSASTTEIIKMLNNK